MRNGLVEIYKNTFSSFPDNELWRYVCHAFNGNISIDNMTDDELIQSIISDILDVTMVDVIFSWDNLFDWINYKQVDRVLNFLICPICEYF